MHVYCDHRALVPRSRRPGRHLPSRSPLSRRSGLNPMASRGHRTGPPSRSILTAKRARRSDPDPGPHLRLGKATSLANDLGRGRRIDRCSAALGGHGVHGSLGGHGMLGGAVGGHETQGGWSRLVTPPRTGLACRINRHSAGRPRRQRSRRSRHARRSRCHDGQVEHGAPWAGSLLDRRIDCVEVSVDARRSRRVAREAVAASRRCDRRNAREGPRSLVGSFGFVRHDSDVARRVETRMPRLGCRDSGVAAFNQNVRWP